MPLRSVSCCQLVLSTTQPDSTKQPASTRQAACMDGSGWLQIKSPQMLNFASLFNQWRTQNNNGVLDILEQPDLDMGRLLDEESFQGEYKSGNAKLQQFMKYDKYQQLVDYVTLIGPPEDKKRSFKYPQAACQILSLENTTALDFFLPDKPLIVNYLTTETVVVQTKVEVELDESPPQAAAESEEAKQQPETKPQESKDDNEIQVLGDKPASDQVQPEEKEAVSELEDKTTTPEKANFSLQVQTPKKKTRTVLKKEERVVEKVEQREAEPLIHRLLSYFQGSVNYTLAGYVCKILTYLLSNRPDELMKHLLQENMMHKIIDHAESRSVGEVIVKVLTHESTLLLDRRREFFQELLDRTSTSSEIQLISNLSSYICEIIEKVATNLKGGSKINEFNTVFFSLSTVAQIIHNVTSDEEIVAVYNAPILLTYLTNVPFVLPEQPQILEQFYKLGEVFVQKSCEKLQVDRKSRPRLGFGRVKVVEILMFVVKENVLRTREVVARSPEFFPTLLNLVQQYPMNNVLHNEVIRIIETALTEEAGTPLNDSVLRDDLLLNFIVEEWEEDGKIKAGESVYKARKGYIAHVINLCVRLQELAESNKNIKLLIENPVFANIYDNCVEKEIFNSKKSLAGLMMKKQQRHQVLFQREDVIASHLTFLQKCPNPVYDPVATPEEPVNIKHPDLFEELQKQLEENLLVKSGEGEGDKEGSQWQDSKSEQPNLAEVMVEIEGEGRFWSTHLEYNIDDLLDDL